MSHICNKYATAFKIYVTQNMNLLLRTALLEMEAYCIFSHATVLLKEMATLKETILKLSSTHLFSETPSK